MPAPPLIPPVPPPPPPPQVAQSSGVEMVAMRIKAVTRARKDFIHEIVAAIWLDGEFRQNFNKMRSGPFFLQACSGRSVLPVPPPKSSRKGKRKYEKSKRIH